MARVIRGRRSGRTAFQTTATKLQSPPMSEWEQKQELQLINVLQQHMKRFDSMPALARLSESIWNRCSDNTTLTDLYWAASDFQFNHSKCLELRIQMKVEDKLSKMPTSEYTIREMRISFNSFSYNTGLSREAATALFRKCRAIDVFVRNSNLGLSRIDHSNTIWSFDAKSSNLIYDALMRLQGRDQIRDFTK
jgi:hypothetical protein